MGVHLKGMHLTGVYLSILISGPEVAPTPKLQPKLRPRYIPRRLDPPIKAIVTILEAIHTHTPTLL
jgi:hypothetical protein